VERGRAGGDAFLALAFLVLFFLLLPAAAAARFLLELLGVRDRDADRRAPAVLTILRRTVGVVGTVVEAAGLVATEVEELE